MSTVQVKKLDRVDFIDERHGRRGTVSLRFSDSSIEDTMLILGQSARAVATQLRELADRISQTEPTPVDGATSIHWIDRDMITDEIHTVATYGTCGVIYAEVGTCTLCGQTAPVISADASSGMFEPALLCEQCVRTALTPFTPVETLPYCDCHGYGIGRNPSICPAYVSPSGHCTHRFSCKYKYTPTDVVVVDLEQSSDKE